ncbi:hypothetical protein E4191_12445 [Paracoccus liaowanqingii]|uniref:Uncharacterized protein n=1 Tax=Paracoccus liaowanqingii TaxID=2560053 RepID=A0A4P7HMH8_9RHOB|nr:hypothetical protein [Paracoccus liaowanqingii]QBX35416.1 hypothetical protein E4191_12445 [Paracoccus liaowanqingii]
MPVFTIVMGAAPHMKLCESGREFLAAGPHMAFDSHDSAYAYVLAHTENEPLKGLRATIIEVLSLENDPT